MKQRHFLKTSVKYSFLLLLVLIIEWTLTTYSLFKIPETIPNTPIKVEGILLIIAFLTFIILAGKKYLKVDPEASILKLTLLGTIICFYSEVIFQILRQPFVDTTTFTGHLYYFSTSVIVMTIFMGVISFLVAFQIKTKRTAQLFLLIVGFLIIINLTKYFIPGVFGPYKF